MDLFSSEKVIIAVVTAANDLEVISSFQFFEQSLCNLQKHAKKANIVWLKWKIFVSLQCVGCLKGSKAYKSTGTPGFRMQFCKRYPSRTWLFQSAGQVMAQ